MSRTTVRAGIVLAVTLALAGAPAAAQSEDELQALLRGFVDEGMQAERAIFIELLGSTESKALRHAFFAERAAARMVAVARLHGRTGTE